MATSAKSLWRRRQQGARLGFWAGSSPALHVKPSGLRGKGAAPVHAGQPLAHTKIAAVWPSFHTEPNGILAAEIDGYKLLIQAPGHSDGDWAYTLLRRQYGIGSLFGLVGSGVEESLAKAVHAAERLAGDVIVAG